MAEGAEGTAGSAPRFISPLPSSGGGSKSGGCASPRAGHGGSGPG